MQNQKQHRWNIRGSLCILAITLAYGGLAQNPPERPDILWHLGTVNTTNPAAGIVYFSFTEDHEYFIQGGSHLQVFKTDWAIDSNVPRGRALVSYQTRYERLVSFTDRDENNREYVVNAVHLAEWVRNAGAYGGGYLRPRRQLSVRNAQVWQPLRGHRDPDRRLNRLLAVGRSDGQVTVVLLDYDNPNSMNTNRVDVQAHAGAVTALAYDAASRTLFTGGVDGLIRSWAVTLNGNQPQLNPRQAVAAHRSQILSLAYEFDRLLSTASWEPVVKCWSVSNGVISATPIWQAELPFQRADNFAYVSPTGHPQLASVFMLDGRFYYWYYGAGSQHLFIDRATGQWVASIVNGFAGSPVFSATKGIWVLNHQFVDSFTPQIAPISGLASSRPVTALGTVGNSTIVAGYANGELRSVNPNSSSTTSHPNRRVIGIADVSRAGAPAVLSADVEGRIVINPVPLGTPLLSFPSGLTSAVSVAVGADATSRLVAIAGHINSQPEVRVFRLTWSGNTPTLTQIASFAPPTNNLSRLVIRFAAANSPDLIVLSGDTLSRWNLSGNSYQRSYLQNSYQATSISVVGTRVWAYTPGSLMLFDAQTGNRLWDSYFHMSNLDAPASAFAAFQFTGRARLIYPFGISDSLEDGPFSVGIAQEIDPNEPDSQFLTTSMRYGIRLFVSDLPTAITVAPNASIAYIGCRDGQVYSAIVPSPNLRAFAYNLFLGGYGTFFGLVGDRLVFSPASQPSQPVFNGWPTQQLSLWSVTNRAPLFETRICSPDNCLIPEASAVFTRLAPSRNTLYSFETERFFSRFVVWGNLQGTPSQLYNLAENSGNQFIFRQWWMIPIDDQRVGFVHAWPTGTRRTDGSEFFEVRLRFFQWSPAPNKAEFAIPINDMRLLDWPNYSRDSQGNPTSPLWRESVVQLRWDINANRRVAAVLGVHRPDPNNPANARWRILLLYRPDPNSWSNWTRTSVLDQGVDFPAGVYPTYLRFHPTNPNLLYVGLSNGRVRIYPHNNGTLQNFTELNPRLGNPGEVRALDVAPFRNQQGSNTAIAFIGTNGISIYTAPECAPDEFREVKFYNIDTSAEGIAHIQLSQPSANADVVMVYGSRLTLSVARLVNLPTYPCSADPCSGENHCNDVVKWTDGDVAPYPQNPQNAPIEEFGDCCVNDQDILAVLFAFGNSYDYNTTFKPGAGDVNCDGVVNDIDLLIVLFNFGVGCNR